MWQIKEDIFIFHFIFFFILVMHGSPVSRNGGFSGGRSKDCTNFPFKRRYLKTNKALQHPSEVITLNHIVKIE